MSVTELQVGDLVMYNGCVCRVYGLMMPVPRKDSRLDGKAVITLYCDGLIDATEDEVSPIELTEEKLKLNGIDMNTFVDLTKPLFTIGINAGDTHIVKRFSTVNEIQHALKLCGLSAFADAFKA